MPAISRRAALSGAAALPALALHGRRAAAQQSQLMLASGYPDGNYHTRTLRLFAERVQALTGGALAITIHSNGSLVRLPEIKRAVQTGQVQLGEVLLGNYGNEDAIFEADSVPFLARGFEEARKLYAAQKPMLERRFERQGLVMLYSVVWPGNGVFSRREISGLGDIAGMKFRAYNALTARLAEHWRAQPVNVQVPELAQAFATGIAEVMVASSPVVVNSRGWDFGRAFYDLRAFNPRNAVLVGTRTWRALPEAQRSAIQQAAAEAEARGWELAAQDERQNLVLMAQNGIKVVEPDAAMQQEMAEAAGAMIGPWAQRAGQDGLALREAMGR
jgi:TRAP-type C4-dicarboxylate transport system substrate-binding protein